eukprot:205665_1
MAQPAADENGAESQDHAWPTSLLLNQAYAQTFQCTICNHIPKSCMTNEDGDVVCNHCANNMDNVVSSKPIQKMINKLKTRCLTTINDNNNVEGTNVMATQVKDNQCDWTGMISEYDEHSKECPYLVIVCQECKSFKCQRKLLKDHVAECPQISINCPLSCGLSILRKNIENHLSADCAEQLLYCCNDDCKIQIKRKDFSQHINRECDDRIVECEFIKYGCSVKQIKASELENHMNEYKVDHLSNKLDFVTTQLMEQNNIISELKSTHNRESNELNRKIMELQQTNDRIALKLIQSGQMQFGIDDSKLDTNEVYMLSRTFEYKNDFDENGVLYFLGCNYGKSNWENPSQRGLVKVISTPMYSNSEPNHHFVGREAVFCLTAAKKNAFFNVDFGTAVIRPTHYTLRHYISRDKACLRNWE